MPGGGDIDPPVRAAIGKAAVEQNRPVGRAIDTGGKRRRPRSGSCGVGAGAIGAVRGRYAVGINKGRAIGQVVVELVVREQYLPQRVTAEELAA